MTTYNKLWQQLETTFQHDIPLTTELLDLLKRERTSLEERDYDTFQKVITQKKPLLNQLEIHALSRQKVLREAGFKDEKSSLAMVQQQAPEVAKAWAELADQWAECQKLNSINERIAQRTRLVVGQIMDLLRGKNNNIKVYTSKGDAKTSSNGRSITNA